MKKTVILPVVVALASLFFFSTCARQQLLNPFQSDLSGWIAPEVKNRLLSGSATSDDLKFIIAKFNENNQVAQVDGATPSAVMTVPETGRLQLTMQDNDAGWSSDVYMTVGSDTIFVFSDTVNGPQTYVSEYAYPAGTTIGFFIVTHAPNGEVITNNANSAACIIDYYANVPKWVLNFRNVPVQANKGGTGHLTGTVNLVINVQMAAAQVVNVSDCFDISIDYLNPWGFTDEGYAIYFIGETMHYNVNVGVVTDSEIFHGNVFTVYAIQEYFEDKTCYRWWYPGEPKEITVSKGDPLPGQDPPQSWSDVSFAAGATTVLNGSHTCPLSVASGNDQTHVIIVSVNDAGQILMTLYDNPECGVYDPPAPAPAP